MSLEALDARTLRHFLAVARVGSIRGAAEHLRIVPSAVSRQVAEIEQRLGMPLFERTARGVVLTEAGTLVLEHARRVIEDQELLAEQLDQLKEARRGLVRLACGEGFIADLFENGLSAFRVAHPSIRFGVTVSTSSEIVSAVVNGDTDIGIAYNPVVNIGVRSIAIARQPLCFVARPGHPILERRAVRLSDCVGHPIVLLLQESAVGQLIGRVAADCSLALAPIVETSSIDLLRRAAESGVGATFLPRFAVASEIARGALGAVDLQDPLLAEASAHLVVRARRRLPGSVERLAGALCQAMVAFRPRDAI